MRVDTRIGSQLGLACPVRSLPQDLAAVGYMVLCLTTCLPVLNASIKSFQISRVLSANPTHSVIMCISSPIPARHSLQRIMWSSKADHCTICMLPGGDAAEPTVCVFMLRSLVGWCWCLAHARGCTPWDTSSCGRIPPTGVHTAPLCKNKRHAVDSGSYAEWQPATCWSADWTDFTTCFMCPAPL